MPKLGDAPFNHGLRLRLITDVVPTRRDLDADGRDVTADGLELLRIVEGRQEQIRPFSGHGSGRHVAKIARRLGYQDGFALKVALHVLCPHTSHDRLG